LPKFAYCAIFKQLNIIQGKHTEIPAVKGEVICLGDCTKEIAKSNNLRHIDGCPPDFKNILETFSKRKSNLNKWMK
jgi:hypothetical protein